MKSKVQSEIDSLLTLNLITLDQNNIPEELKLKNEFSIRVSEAPETFEIHIEHYSYQFWKRWLYIVVIWALIATVCSIILIFPIKQLDKAYSKFPYNRD